MQPFALIVDDDPSIHRSLARELEKQGCEVASATSGEDGLAAAHRRRPQLVMLDIHMEGMSGIETLKRLSAELPGVPVVIMTGEGSIELAVEAFKNGAVDFVTKPFDRPKLLTAIRAGLSRREAQPSSFEAKIIGESPALQAALEQAKMFAWPDINVLLNGETGTGKELFARAIHGASKRKDGPFVALDCSNLAPTVIESELFGHEKDSFTGATQRRIGRFEQAQGGTLFLDEVGNLSLDVQRKLLRALQERTIERVGGNKTIELDIRLISATNVDLEACIAAGTFKRDFYHRLVDTTITPPPLRDRKGDIALLARHFIGAYAGGFGSAARDIDGEALAILEGYSFPGNVRELESIMKAAVIHAFKSPLVRPAHLPLEMLKHGAVPSAAPAGRAEPETGGKRLRVTLDIDLEKLDLKTIGNHAAEQAQKAVLQHVLGQGERPLIELSRLFHVDVKTLKEKLKQFGLR